MAPKALHDMAQTTTPPDVDVPNTYLGVLVWALGKFGGTVVGAVMVCAVFAYAAYLVYQDNHGLMDRMMMVLEKRAAVDGELARALTDNANAINSLKDEAKSAHSLVKTK